MPGMSIMRGWLRLDWVTSQQDADPKPSAIERHSLVHYWISFLVYFLMRLQNNKRRTVKSFEIFPLVWKC